MNPPAHFRCLHLAGVYELHRPRSHKQHTNLHVGRRPQHNVANAPPVRSHLVIDVVKNPTINHKNFFADRTGVGIAPTLRWSPPSVGTATYYNIQIYQLANNGGNTTKTLIANLYTSRTSLLVPKGLLTAGQAYVFRIRTLVCSGHKICQNTLRDWSDVRFSRCDFRDDATVSLAAKKVKGSYAPAESLWLLDWAIPYWRILYSSAL